MFTKNNTQSGFAKAARLLTTLVIMIGLAAFVSPASSMAAKPAPQQAVGIMTAHVTNYQHGNDIQGVWVYAVSPVNAAEYKAETGKDGVAKLEMPAGIYQVTVHVTSLFDPYEPWSQYVNVAPDTTTSVEARIIVTSEMYPLKLAAVDAVSLSMVADAKVRIYDENGQTVAEGVTDKYGSFITKVPPGIFLATVLHPKYEAHKDFVKIVSGQSNSTLVGLAPVGEPSLGDMQIHAYDAYNGGPIQGAVLTVYNAKGNIIDQGMTDATGTYYTCLPEGKYKVEVTAPKYISYSGAHQIVAGTLTHYKVLLVPLMER
jgi:5-hydroxyisourate hydrolase-like protein (transthyretin family)